MLGMYHLQFPIPSAPMCSPFRHECIFSYTHGVSTWLALAMPNALNAHNPAMCSPFRCELICSQLTAHLQNLTRFIQNPSFQVIKILLPSTQEYC